MTLETFDDFTKGDLQEDVISKTSSLNAGQYTDNIAFDSQFEGVPAGSLMYGGLQIKKTRYADNTAGIWEGIDTDGKAKMYLGDSTNYLKWNGTALDISGSITATTGTIGGFTIGSTSISGGTNLVLSSTGEGIITTGTLRTDSSGTRMQITAATQRLEAINANGDVVANLNWSSTSAAVLRLYPAYYARRALEIILPASFTSGSESDAKAITIDNAADSICIDITNGGLVGLQIAACDTSAIKVTSAATNAATVELLVGSADYPVIDLSQDGTSTNSYGIRIAQGTGALKAGIFIDCNADSNVTPAIYLDRDSNVDSQMVSALKIDASNAGTGTAVGIDFNVYKTAIFKCTADNTSIATSTTDSVGRIPILAGSTLRYIPYF